MTTAAGLPGEWNAVIVTFQREQQELAGSWVPWLDQRTAADPRLGFAKLPAIGLQRQPSRPVIDGGMAAAIGDQKTRRRTPMVHTGIRRVTLPLGIANPGGARLPEWCLFSSGPVCRAAGFAECGHRQGSCGVADGGTHGPVDPAVCWVPA